MECACSVLKKLVDPSEELLADDDDLSAIQNGDRYWSTQFSGVKLEDEVANALESLVVGRQPKPVVHPKLSSADIKSLGQSTHAERYERDCRLRSALLITPHKALAYLGDVVVRALGGEHEYRCKLTSGFSPVSGVRSCFPQASMVLGVCC